MTGKVASWHCLELSLRMKPTERLQSIVMAKTHNKEQIGGSAVRVADCHIWATIHYLDSPTSYHEYLPSNRRSIPRSEGELVMLDDKHSLDWVTSLYFIVGVLLTLTISIVLIRTCT